MRRFKTLFTSLVVFCICLLFLAGLLFLPRGGSAHAAFATASTTCKGWHLVPSPPVSSEATLRGVAHVASNDIWTVGAEPIQGSSAQPIVLHWNGSAWSLVPIPSPSTFPTGLYGVAAISVNDVWATGDYVDVKTRNTLTLTEHWNGTKWSIVPSPNPSTMASNVIEDTLSSIIAFSTNDVWAAGSSDATYNPLVEHWNGSKWSVVPAPNPAPNHENSEFTTIGGSATNDLWAVGDQNDGHFGVSLIEHWNGSKWSVVSNPGTSLPSWNGLYSVTTTSPTDAWAVGYYQGSPTESPIIEHWNGKQWSIVPGPNVNGPTTLYGVVAASSTNAWAVGSISSGSYPIVIEHWNGTSWKIALSLSHQPTGGVAYAATLIFHTLWVVGEDYYSTSQVLIGYYCA